METRILLVEDEEHLARGLAFNLEAEGYKVESFERGEPALERLAGDSAIDLLVLDVGKEFVNIIVGHICTWLSREGINTMPLPPDYGEGACELPHSWEGDTRTINVRLVMARGEVVLSILVPTELPKAD